VKRLTGFPAIPLAMTDLENSYGEIRHRGKHFSGTSVIMTLAPKITGSPSKTFLKRFLFAMNMIKNSAWRRSL
jgi:hypothetical protein